MSFCGACNHNSYDSAVFRPTLDNRTGKQQPLWISRPIDFRDGPDLDLECRISGLGYQLCELIFLRRQ